MKLNATKDKFFSIIAHDLKNPFNTMLGFSEFLLKKFDDYDKEKQKKFIGIIRDDIENTYKLLENLLLWSQSQRGQLEYMPEKENLFLSVSESVELLDLSASSKKISLINKINENIYVNVDSNMLSTVIRNLISNAIKFTPENGKIIIKSKVVKSDDKRNYNEITVEDTGIGISKEKLKKIFSNDENTSTRGTAGERGTGLGLILCKEFVEKHKGNIRAESEVGKGSKFIFTLPLYE